MQLVYISAPIRSNDYRTMIANIQYGLKLASKYWELGYAVICPHANTALSGIDCTNITDEMWLEGDFEMIKRSDLVVFGALDNRWKQSTGCIAEHKIAMDCNKECIYEFEEMSEMRKHHVPKR